MLPIVIFRFAAAHATRHHDIFATRHMLMLIYCSIVFDTRMLLLLAAIRHVYLRLTPCLIFLRDGKQRQARSVRARRRARRAASATVARARRARLLSLIFARCLLRQDVILCADAILMTVRARRVYDCAFAREQRRDAFYSIDSGVAVTFTRLLAMFERSADDAAATCLAITWC